MLAPMSMLDGTSAVASVMAEVGQGPDGAGRMVFSEADVPALKEQLRTYLRRFKEAGFYGKAPLALYSGSNALTQLATSPDPEDAALYREICTFFADLAKKRVFVQTS